MSWDLKKGSMPYIIILYYIIIIIINNWNNFEQGYKSGTNYDVSN